MDRQPHGSEVTWKNKRKSRGHVPHCQ